MDFIDSAEKKYLFVWEAKGLYCWVTLENPILTLHLVGK